MKEVLTKYAGLFLWVFAALTSVLFTNKANGQSVTAGFTYTSNCLNFEFQNTSVINGAVTIDYQWNFGDGVGTSILENPSYTYDGPGEYHVTLTVTIDEGITDAITKTVNAVFTFANFSYSQECELFHFTNLSSPSGSIDSVYWHFGEGDTVKIFSAPFNYDYTYAGSGNYNVYLKTFVDGCSDSKNSDIELIVPIPDFTYTQVVDTFYFHDQSTPVEEITSWLWDFGDGFTSTDQNPSHYYVFPGNFNITLQITTLQGCIKSKSRPLVFYQPIADFNYYNNCGTFYFTDSSSPADSIVSWAWDFGDGVGFSSLQNPVYTYSNDGAYKVMLQVFLESGSSDTSSQWVSFYHPVPKFSHGPACLGLSTCFYDESIPGSGNITSWNWNFGNGSSSSLQNPCYTYGVSGTYYLTLTVQNDIGCSSISDQDTLIIDSPPVANFTYSSSCFSEITSFTNLTDTNNVAVSSWNWDFGDPGSGSNNTASVFEPEHLFSSEGSFQVTLSVENIYGCIANTVNTVLVDSIPEANFTKPDTVASNTLFTITDHSVAHGTPILTRIWNFGDGNTSINPNPVNHTYLEPGIYDICLIVINLKGCSDTTCQTIVVTSLPFADFEFTLSPDLKVNFFDDSYSGSTITNWFWDFGDPTVLSDTVSGNPNPFYTYPSEGFYPVTLEITDIYNGKQDTTKTIYVGKAIHAGYSSEDVCIGDSVKFIDESYSLVSAQLLYWTWNFGDNTFLQYYQKRDSITHFYEGAGTYEVSLVTTGILNGFIVNDTIIKQITVYNLPVAEIYDEHLIVCLGQPIHFVDSSYSVDGDIINSWNWEFGDGSNSTFQNPSHTFNGIDDYQVVLTIGTTHFCVNTDTVIAKVTIAPDIDFVVKNACVNSPAYFIHTDSDIEITDWLWNFNDPYSPGIDTSTLEAPTYTYSNINVYHVSMEASSYGCKKKVEKSFLVYPIPFSNFTYTPNYTGVQGRTLFDNGSIYAKNYLWDFGNGHTSTVEDPIEVYEYDSTYTITLISYNEYGCSDTSRKELKVFFRGLYIPTAFSPNNPNYEVSRFMPKGINLAEYNIQVFDLKGSLIWESDKLDEYGSPLESWDGYYDGRLMPEGIYVWNARGIFRDGSEWKGSDLQYDNPKTNGTVTLIR